MISIETLKASVENIILCCLNTLEYCSTPNKQIIELILKEFSLNFDLINNSNKIIVLNPQRELWALKVIDDSADFNYDQELFNKIRNFKDLCKKADASIVTYQYNY